MDDWRNWFGILFALVFGYLWWRFSRTYHDDVREGDEVQLLPSLKYIFGKPNEIGVYSIRGIYNQLFISLIVVVSIFYDLEIISLRQLSQILMMGIFSFPVLELARYILKRIR